MPSRQRAAPVYLDAKIEAQLDARGWIERQIREAVDAPIGISTDNTGGKAEPATVYGSNEGGYVVINDMTRRVIQISDKNNPRPGTRRSHRMEMRP
jgi:hypothetical protein